MSSSDPKEDLPENETPELNVAVDNSESEDAENDEQAEELTPLSVAGQEVDRLQDELIKAREQMLRALAEAENTRKRAIKDREDAGKYAVSSFAKDLLDFSDNFHRALEAIPEDAKDNEQVQSIIAGLEAMQREMLSTFSKHGIEKMEPLDQPFDPNFHEVMFESPSPDKKPGTIIQLIEPGYTLHGRLLRPARVGIAQTSDSGADPGDTVDTEA